MAAKPTTLPPLGKAPPPGATSPPRTADLAPAPVAPPEEDLDPLPDIDTLFQQEIQRCMDYVFPQAVINKAFIRVIVYAKYGPGARQDDGSVKLGCGGKRVLHHFEEKQLFADESAVFVTDTYGGSLASTSLTGTGAAVDNETFGEMNRKKSKWMLDAMEMTQAELMQVLSNAKQYLGANSNTKSRDGSTLAKRVRTAPLVTSSSSGTTPADLFMPANTRRIKPSTERAVQLNAVFDAISTALLAERRRRIAALRCATPVREVLRTDVNVTQRQTQHFYNKTAPKAYTIRSFEDPKDVLRSLHRSACLIVDPADKNSTAVTLNVRCLRPDFIPDPNKPGWDGYCCVRGANPARISTLRSV